MNRTLVVLITFLVLVSIVGCPCAKNPEEPTPPLPTVEPVIPTHTPLPTPTKVKTYFASLTPTMSPTISPTSTDTPTPTITATPVIYNCMVSVGQVPQGHQDMPCPAYLPTSQIVCYMQINLGGYWPQQQLSYTYNPPDLITTTFSWEHIFNSQGLDCLRFSWSNNNWMFNPNMTVMFYTYVTN